MNGTQNIEVSLAGAKATVMIYDDMNKKWLPSGSSPGLSKVQLLHNQNMNTYRVVGRKLADLEVVINCHLAKGLKYNQANQTFLQWRDSKQVYGLNFQSKDEADAFTHAMKIAVDSLSRLASDTLNSQTSQKRIQQSMSSNGVDNDENNVQMVNSQMIMNGNNQHYNNGSIGSNGSSTSSSSSNGINIMRNASSSNSNSTSSLNQLAANQQQMQINGYAYQRQSSADQNNLYQQQYQIDNSQKIYDVIPDVSVLIFYSNFFYHK